MIKNIMISVAPNARIRNSWREVSRTIYVRWRFNGSEVMWLWLARIIRGRSQQVKTRRGVERGSVAICRPRWDQPVSEKFFRQLKLVTAIVRLKNNVIGHNRLEWASHAMGMSIRVGTKIFNTEGG